LNNTDKHRLITVLATTLDRYEFQGFFRDAKVYQRVPLHPNAKVGYVLPLPEGGVTILAPLKGRSQYGIQREVQVDGLIKPEVRFGSGCDAVEGLPVIPRLHDMANEVSRVIESFAREF
jgi:hypothetical protein